MPSSPVRQQDDLLTITVRVPPATASNTVTKSKKRAKEAK